MELFRLILLQILLLSVILAVASAKKKQHTAVSDQTTSIDKHKSVNIHHGVLQHGKKHKKAKRSAYRRDWSAKLASYTGYMPPYLVYNRKTGAYHPYFSYPKDNYLGSNRRSMQWKNQNQHHKK